MAYLYLLFNIICIYFGIRLYNTWFNPISIYALVWGFSVGLHESNLILYYDLSSFCWFIIIISQLMFTIGCYFGKRIKHKNEIIIYNNELLKIELKKGILFTTFIAAVAIVGNFITAINIYGSNLFDNLTDIYADRVYQTRDIESIPYLGAFIFILMPLSGVYLKKYGFSLLLIPSLVLALLSALSSGGRAGIVFDIILFGSAYYLVDSSNTFTVVKEKATKLSGYKRKVILLLSIITLLIMVVLLTNRRGSGVAPTYASDTFKLLFGNNIIIYKFVEYFASPVGVLNEYLKTNEFHFAHNSLLPILNILNRLGLIDRVDQYQKFFYTPIYSNVGTWLRELIEDFTIYGELIAVIFLSLITSFLYKRSTDSFCVRRIVVVSVLLLVLTLSFFDWRLRTSNMWIALFFGSIIGKRIDDKSKVDIVYD